MSLAYTTLAIFSPRRVALQQHVEVSKPLGFCFDKCLSWEAQVAWNPLIPEDIFGQQAIAVDTSAKALYWEFSNTEAQGSAVKDSIFTEKEIRWLYTIIKNGDTSIFRTAMVFEGIPGKTRITWQFQGEERTFLAHPINLFYSEALKQRFEISIPALKEFLEK
jgi:hypothetical protein